MSTKRNIELQTKKQKIWNLVAWMVDASTSHSDCSKLINKFPKLTLMLNNKDDQITVLRQILKYSRQIILNQGRKVIKQQIRDLMKGMNLGLHRAGYQARLDKAIQILPINDCNLIPSIEYGLQNLKQCQQKSKTASDFVNLANLVSLKIKEGAKTCDIATDVQGFLKQIKKDSDGSNSFKTQTLKTAKTRQYASTEWFWTGRIPRGMLGIIGASGGCGKSTFSNYVASILSSGEQFFDGKKCNKKLKTLFITTQNSWKYSIKYFNQFKPDQNMIVQMQPIQMPYINLATDIDMTKLRNTIKSSNIDLVFIDPIDQFTPDADLNKAQQVISFMDKLKQLAQQTKATIIIIAHTNKDTSKVKQLKDLISGSGKMTNSCKFAYVMFKSKIDDCVYLNLAKSNQKMSSQAIKFNYCQTIKNGISQDGFETQQVEQIQFSMQPAPSDFNWEEHLKGNGKKKQQESVVKQKTVITLQSVGQFIRSGVFLSTLNRIFSKDIRYGTPNKFDAQPPLFTVKQIAKQNGIKQRQFFFILDQLSKTSGYSVYQLGTRQKKNNSGTFETIQLNQKFINVLQNNNHILDILNQLGNKSFLSYLLEINEHQNKKETVTQEIF